MNATPATAPAWATPGSPVLVTWTTYRARSIAEGTRTSHLHLRRANVLRVTKTLVVLDDGRRFNHDCTAVGQSHQYGQSGVRILDPETPEAADLVAAFRLQRLRTDATKAATTFASDPSNANADALLTALTLAREAQALDR